MKKALIIAVTVIAMLVVVSCAGDVKDPDADSPYAVYPFTEENAQKPIQVTTTERDVKGIFLLHDVSLSGDYWIVALKDSEGSKEASAIKIGSGSTGIVEGTWDLKDSKFSLNCSDKINISNVTLDWKDWSSNAKVSVSAGQTFGKKYVFEKIYDDANLTVSIDKSALTGLWIHTDDYGTEGYRFLDGSSVWEYYTNKTSAKFNCEVTKNQIKITDGTMPLNTYYFAIVGDDLYLKDATKIYYTRYTKVEE